MDKNLPTSYDIKWGLEEYWKNHYSMITAEGHHLYAYIGNETIAYIRRLTEEEAEIATEKITRWNAWTRTH